MNRALRAKLDGMTTGQRRDFEMALVWRCPQYETCSTPRCPLDPLYHDRDHVSFPDDEKCNARKSTRLRIVAEAEAEGLETVAYLPYGGLTGREDSARLSGERERARFEAMTPEEQEVVRERLRRGREALRESREAP